MKFHRLKGVSIAGLVISSLLFAIGVDEKALALLTRGVACRGRARREVVDLRALVNMMMVVLVLTLVRMRMSMKRRTECAWGFIADAKFMLRPLEVTGYRTMKVVGSTHINDGAPGHIRLRRHRAMNGQRRRYF